MATAHTLPTTATDGAIRVPNVDEETIVVPVRGTTPLICNRLSEKARRELLFPKGGRKTTADRASSLKHDPYAEFRASPYLFRDETMPTSIYVPAGTFKGAMMTAALRLPGAKKTEVGNLVTVAQRNVPIFGIPQIFSSIVRSADMNRTPDVRTRAILPRWAAVLEVSFVTPLITRQSVINLLSGGGKLAGIGDWRREKGKGDFGGFVLVDAEDVEFREIVEAGGRAAQLVAMDYPAAYDDETEELLAWFGEELTQRGRHDQLEIDTTTSGKDEYRNGHDNGHDAHGIASDQLTTVAL